MNRIQESQNIVFTRGRFVTETWLKIPVKPNIEEEGWLRLKKYIEPKEFNKVLSDNERLRHAVKKLNEKLNKLQEVHHAKTTTDIRRKRRRRTHEGSVGSQAV